MSLRIWQTVLIGGALHVLSAQASSRYSCAEITRPKFLDSFNLQQNGASLFRSLFQDQLDALKFPDACMPRRWAVLAKIYRSLPAEDLKNSDLQVQIGRMMLLQGTGDLGNEHFSLALKFNPKNADAIYYASEGARKKGNREQERALLEGLAASDFADRSAQRGVFDEAFGRLSTLVTASEAQALIDGPWKRLDKTSRLRAKRGLEIAQHLGNPQKMEQYFLDAFGSGDLGNAPDWAHLLKAQYFMLKQEPARALQSFDRSLRMRKDFLKSEMLETESWLELASLQNSHWHLRNWSERILKQSWAATLEPKLRSSVERFYIEALEGGALNARTPVKDLERAQAILPKAPEILLLSAEVLLSQRPPFKPEGAYRNRKTAFEKARTSLRYLQAQGDVSLDASYWEVWMDWGLGRLQQVRGRSDIVFSELQQGKNFKRVKSLENFWEICRALYTRTRGLRDYRAKLRLIANDRQVAESVRQSAQKELETLQP